jgi:hypothetical protein
MRVTYANNTLTVVTNIPKASVERGIASLVAKDENGNHLYAVSMSKDGSCSIDNNGLKGNVFVDDKLAVVKVMPADTKLEDVQKEYGKYLVKASKFTDEIATAAAAEEATIEDIFATDAQ